VEKGPRVQDYLGGGGGTGAPAAMVGRDWVREKAIGARDLVTQGWLRACLAVYLGNMNGAVTCTRTTQRGRIATGDMGMNGVDDEPHGQERHFVDE
jgi:hypothetical protein